MYILLQRVLLLEDKKTRIQKDKKKSKETKIIKTKTPTGQEDVDTKTSKIQRKTKTQKETSLFFFTCLSIFARSYRRVNTGNVPPFKIFQIARNDELQILMDYPQYSQLVPQTFGRLFC